MKGLKRRKKFTIESNFKPLPTLSKNCKLKLPLPIGTMINEEEIVDDEKVDTEKVEVMDLGLYYKSDFE